MASNAEILALQSIGGNWGSELVNDTAWYTPPPGYAIKAVLAQEETVINEAYFWEKLGVAWRELAFSDVDDKYQTPKNWLDQTLASGALITMHDKYPMSRLQLTSGSVMVYFCKGPTANATTTLITTTSTTTEAVP